MSLVEYDKTLKTLAKILCCGSRCMCNAQQ